MYCVPLELKKVINTELLDISVSRQSDNVRARVENSHGILKDCFQQSVVQLAQAFDVWTGTTSSRTSPPSSSSRSRSGTAWPG